MKVNLGLTNRTELVFVSFVLTFICFQLGIIAFVNFLWFLIMVYIVAIIHELGHIMSCYYYKKPPVSLNIALNRMFIITPKNITKNEQYNITFFGPFANVLLGLIFSFIYTFTNLGSWSTTIFYFLMINFVFIVVNLIPVEPLDGYTLFRPNKANKTKIHKKENEM